MENQLITKILEREDIDLAASCIANVFQDEPMAKMLKATEQDIFPLAKAYCTKSAEEGLSIVTLSPDKESVVSFSVSEDFTLTPPDSLEIEKLSSKSYPILSLLETVTAQYKESVDHDPSKILHIFMVGARTEWRGKGLVSANIKKNIEIAKSKSFKGCVGEATGVVSQHICKKLGFVRKNSVSYQSFEFENQRVFQDITESDGCVVMEKMF